MPLCMLPSLCLLSRFSLRSCCAFKIHTLYLHKSTCKPTWIFLWNMSPTSLTIVRIQATTNCVLTHFSIAFWTIQFVAIFKSTFFFSHLSSLSFCLSFFDFFYNYLVHVLRIFKYSTNVITCDFKKSINGFFPCVYLVSKQIK